MIKGSGWYKENKSKKTTFEVELALMNGEIIGQTINEIAPNGQKLPPAVLSGKFENGIIKVEKTYKGIHHSHIYYALEQIDARSFRGSFTVNGCPGWDFNCMQEVANGVVAIVLDEKFE